MRIAKMMTEDIALIVIRATTIPIIEITFLHEFTGFFELYSCITLPVALLWASCHKFLCNAEKNISIIAYWIKGDCKSWLLKP